MIVDTSAVVAVVRADPDADEILGVMRDAETLSMGTPTALELSLALGAGRVDRGTDLLHQLGIRLVDFGRAHLVVAQHAFVTYGRGSGSQARLNFGDCMTYALVKVTGEPLLFKGDHFTHTDVTPAR